MPKKKNPNNNYFNQQVEDAICRFIHSTDKMDREKDFRIIYPALCKIAEVWYHKVKFSYSDDDVEDIMAECVAWLVEKLPMFKCGQGTKAFSYFTVTARFYYIQLANKNYKYFQRTIPISSMDENWDIENDDKRNNELSESSKLLFDFLSYCEINFDSIFRKALQPYARLVLDVVANYEDVPDLRKRKFLQHIYKVGKINEYEKTNINKAINAMSSHYTLFKRKWNSGNISYDLCIKDYLNSEEKEIVKNTVKIGKKNNGATALARKFGVSVDIIMNYAKSI